MSRPVPHDVDAEESLLGAFLLSNTAVESVFSFLDPFDFYSTKNQTIASTIYAMWSVGDSIDTVTVAERLERMGDLETSGGRERLHSLQNAVPAISAAPEYARVIVEHSRRRRLISHFAQLADRAYDRTSDVDDIVDSADPITADRLIGSRDVAVSDLWDMRDFVNLTDEQKQRSGWLIPGLIRRGWRMVLVGEEGTGKFVFLRQLALHAAAGRDPFDAYSKFIDPIRVLTIDAENAQSTVAHQSAIVNTNPQVDLIVEAEDRSHIWHREAGVNLRSRRGKAELEAAIREVRPDLVVAGPVYKLMRRSQREDLEQATIEFTEVVDDLRTRYNFAIILEHHMAKGSSGAYRSSDPFGSAVWKRWPELGYAIRSVAGTGMELDYFELERFREDREPANWPFKLEKRKLMSGVAWQGTWRHPRGDEGL